MNIDGWNGIISVSNVREEMPMNFTATMQNLAIGIIGGIYSSIVVSVIFYILTELQNELIKAKDKIHPFYSLAITYRIKEIGGWDYKNYARENCEKAIDIFSRYDPKEFRYEVAEAMNYANEVLQNPDYFKDVWDDQTVELCGKDAEECIKRIENCEKKFRKMFVRRVVRNKILITMTIIFFIILICA